MVALDALVVVAIVGPGIEYRLHGYQGLLSASPTGPIDSFAPGWRQPPQWARNGPGMGKAAQRGIVRGTKLLVNARSLRPVQLIAMALEPRQPLLAREPGIDVVSAKSGAQHRPAVRLQEPRPGETREQVGAQGLIGKAGQDHDPILASVELREALAQLQARFHHSTRKRAPSRSMTSGQ